MKGYKIYLTRPREVADIICTQKAEEMDASPDQIECVRNGCAYGCMELPEHLRDTGYEYVLVEYINLEHPKYEVIFA